MFVDLCLIAIITVLAAVMMFCLVVVAVKVNEISKTLDRVDIFVDTIEYKLKNANARKLTIKPR